MRKILMILAAITLLAGALMMTGCSSRDNDLVGTWVWDLDSNFVTTFNDDGTGTHAIDWGWGTTFEWSTRSNRLYWDYPGHDAVYTEYSVSGDTLTITDASGIDMIYIRQ